MLDRFFMVQRSICLDVFLELFRIVLPTGFIASELVCCFDMMDARQFLVMPVTCPKKKPVSDARHKNISRRFLLFDRHHQESRLVIMSLRPWLSL